MPLEQELEGDHHYGEDNNNNNNIDEHNNSIVSEDDDNDDHDDVDDDDEQVRWMAAGLAGLQLPHMPSMSIPNTGSAIPLTPPNEVDLAPFVRLLVVADLDLASAAALAEFALKPPHKSKFSRVDMCLALGPFCRRQDLQPYLANHTASSNPLAYDNTNICGNDDEDDDDVDEDEEPDHHHQHHTDNDNDDDNDHMNPIQMTNDNIQVPSPHAVNDDDEDDDDEVEEEDDEDAALHEDHTPSSQPQHDYDQWSSSSSASSSCGPTTPEEGAALEGLVTGALSQLESIVCRVLFCPGHTDPPTLHSTYPVERRLTPNSRNIQASWIPLAPGLGCAGLYDPHFHRRLHDLSQHNNNKAQPQFHQHDENNEFRYQLQRLVRLAPPPPSSSLPLFSTRTSSQTILVTTNHCSCPNTNTAHNSNTSKLPTSSSPTLLPHDPSVVLQIAVSSPSSHRNNSTMTSSMSSSHKTTNNYSTPGAASSSSSSSSSSTVLCTSLQGSVLHVGSLRHAGTFCFLDVAMMECATATAKSTSASLSNSGGPPEYQWQVMGVEVLDIYE